VTVLRQHGGNGGFLLGERLGAVQGSLAQAAGERRVVEERADRFGQLGGALKCTRTLAGTTRQFGVN
jgi:hypothetical protein